MFETELAGWAAAVAEVPLPSSDAGVIDEIRALEVLKCAAEARQARLAAALPDDRGAGAQVGWARRESPHRGRRDVGLARVLTGEMPCTMAAFTAGRIGQWQAMVLARETACLSRADRAEVDRQVAGDPVALEAMGPAAIAAAARAVACRLDPAGVVARRRKAESERCVSIRPAPDTMAWVSALLPVAQGVAVWATLSRTADAARAAGDPRGRGQVMADALVAAVASPAAASSPAEPTPDAMSGTGPVAVPVGVNLLVTDEVLFGGVEAEAHLEGYGPVPGEVARELVTAAVSAKVKATLRRIYTDPDGAIVAADARTRCFPAALAGVIRLRDQTCRSPWCQAPIRHVDHVVPAAAGGPTSLANGQGLCEDCNYTKDLPGWTARPRPGPGPGPHAVEVTTPTGHTYRTRAPDPPGGRHGPRVDYRFPLPVAV